jgi:hypothetical protein
MNKAFIFKLDSGKSDELDKSTAKQQDNIILTSTINMPLISLGFHAFIHRTKNAMGITKNLKTQNKFYYVVNPYEHTIPNYNDSLKNLTTIYFGGKETPGNIIKSIL